MQGYQLYKLMCKEVTLQGILEARLCTRLHLQRSCRSDEASSNQRLLLCGFPESSMIRAEHQRITFLRAPLKAEDVLQGRPQLLFMTARQALLSPAIYKPACIRWISEVNCPAPISISDKNLIFAV